MQPIQTVVENKQPVAQQSRRKTNPLNRIFFPHTAWWLLLLLPFIAIGFWPRYWSKLGGNLDAVLHIHTALMMAWVVTGLAQPFLIALKKIQWHRWLGKASYVVMPLLLVSGYFLVQQRYHRKLAQINADVAAGKAQFTAEQIPGMAASTLGLGLVYFALLAVLYVLAIVNRKKFAAHGTYMLGAILTALGPSLDRVIGEVYKANGWKMDFWGARGTVLFTILLFIALAFYQKRKGQRIRPSLVTAGMYTAAFILLQFATKTIAWRWMVECLF
jgi:hypothetical protein